MRFPKMKAPTKKRVFIDRFRGYDHRPGAEAGSFYDMQNLIGSRAQPLRTRPKRVSVQTLQGCPVTRVNTLGGQGDPVVLDRDGTLWHKGVGLPRLLEGNVLLQARDEALNSVSISAPAQLVRHYVRPGSYRYVYQAVYSRWHALDGTQDLPAGMLTPQSLENGMQVSVYYAYTLRSSERRRLVFLGAWALVFPDGKYVNTARLGQGETMRPFTDYGDIAQHNSCDLGGTLFTPCDPDGETRTVVWSDTAPAGGCWVDSSEEAPVLRVWSQSQESWAELQPFIKCSIPGIARGLNAGDSVQLFCRLMGNQGPEPVLSILWDGPQVLAGAWHDPGGEGRDEGAGDYVILPGLLNQSYELELTTHDQSYFEITRELPEMDYVVEAGNRLWGCRCAGEINELYGSKLGDFRNWSVFEGLSTDSYRVSRGSSGPYTGAAVLGGCPLFFRENGLEKIYPSAKGDHGVVSVSLEGIEAGSADSAVVVRDRLYYKSPTGVCCYNGTLPVRISAALGLARYHEAAGAVYGSFVYFSMRDSDEYDHVFVLDTDTGLWYREDDLGFSDAWSGGGRLYLLPMAGLGLLCMDPEADSRGVEWWAETGDLLPHIAQRRYVTRLQLTAKLDPGSELRAYLSYDGGPWLSAGRMTGGSLRAVTLPLFARRCQRLRLRLEGSGGMELHSLSWLTEQGSDV